MDFSMSILWDLSVLVGSLGLLIFLAYRGLSVVVLAPVLSLLAALVAGGDAGFHTLFDTYLPGLGGYFLTYLFVFLSGAIFGETMRASGLASAVARGLAGFLGPDQAVVVTVLVCALLTYGGVSLFVVAFAVYPVALDLFEQRKANPDLIPACIALGSFTFTMTALPGSPQVQNVIPTSYFGTTVYAGAALGLIAAVMMAGCGIFYLQRQMQSSAPSTRQTKRKQPDRQFYLAMIPILSVVVLVKVFSEMTFGLDGDQSKYRGVAGLSLAVILATVLVLLITRFRPDQPKKKVDFKLALNDGIRSGLTALMNTSSEVGYGRVMASLPGFAIVRQAVAGQTQFPLLTGALAVSMLAGITGSASGGLSIALESLGSDLLSAAQSSGLSAETLHRVVVLACGGLDSLPHNGAVITLLGICNTTHKRSYRDLFVVSVFIPIATLLVLATAIEVLH
jgi:H+/gluconate symporter-like permease